jgi:hypothetical protein
VPVPQVCDTVVRDRPGLLCADQTEPICALLFPSPHSCLPLAVMSRLAYATVQRLGLDDTEDSAENIERRRMGSVRRALRRCAAIISLRTAPCRDESRDCASANRPPESFINGLVFTLKGLTLAR